MAEGGVPGPEAVRPSSVATYVGSGAEGGDRGRNGKAHAGVRHASCRRTSEC